MSPRAKLLNLVACALGAWGLVAIIVALVAATVRSVLS